MTAPAMTAPVRFLQALGKLVTSAGLYPANHPARRGAVSEATEALEALLAEGAPAVFSFLEERVIYGDQPLEGLGNWPWSGRLNQVGVQRLELAEGAGPGELERFATSLALELGLTAAKMTESAEESLSGPPQERHLHIRYGPLGVRVARKEREEAKPTETLPLDLSEEAEALEHVHEVAAKHHGVPEAETAAIVGTLLVAVRSARELVAPLIQIRETDEYTTTHCMNVSLLSMSTAEYLRLSDADVTAIGESGLLHDIGKTRIPPHILNKPGKLTVQERAVVEHHVTEGARMLLRSERRNPLASVVAYEHHMHWNGRGGYPRPGVDHEPHRFSRLVQLCDVFDALRTRRPWRPPYTADAALDFLESRAGSEFDPELVEAFASMMRKWEPRLLQRENGLAAPVEEAGREPGADAAGAEAPAGEAAAGSPAEAGSGPADAGAPEPDRDEAGDLARRAERSERGFDADMEGELFEE